MLKEQIIIMFLSSLSHLFYVQKWWKIKEAARGRIFSVFGIFSPFYFFMQGFSEDYDCRIIKIRF